MVVGNPTGPTTVTFLGSANQIGTIGDLGSRIDTVIFSGPTGSVANLSNSKIFSGVTEFGNTAINISGGSAVINSPTNVNANINLGSNQLTFENGTLTLPRCTWGPNTSINTNLTTTDGTNVNLGSINVADIVHVTANSTIVVNLIPGANVPLSFKSKVVNVSGSGGVLNLNGSTFVVKGQPSAYSKADSYIDTANSDVYVVGTNQAAQIVPLDIAAAGGDSIDMQNAMLLVNATSGNA